MESMKRWTAEDDIALVAAVTNVSNLNFLIKLGFFLPLFVNKILKIFA